MSADDESPSAGRTILTDGRDGYPASRAAIFGAIGRHRASSALGGGDIHATVPACQIRGTSISSRGVPQSDRDTRLSINPQLKCVRRACCLLIPEQPAILQVRAVALVKTPTSPIEPRAWFVVEDRRPGLRGARAHEPGAVAACDRRRPPTDEARASASARPSWSDPLRANDCTCRMTIGTCPN
jgi:hypothetical protein